MKYHHTCIPQAAGKQVERGVGSVGHLAKRDVNLQCALPGSNRRPFDCLIEVLLQSNATPTELKAHSMMSRSGVRTMFGVGAAARVESGLFGRSDREDSGNFASSWIELSSDTRRRVRNVVKIGG